MPGILYIVATPIGNLDDMPPRVAATFGAADFVAAEDTRVTLKLLNHFGIKKPMISYFEHNRFERGEIICQRLENGENAALVSDAGMPAISDPGELLVKQCAQRDIPVLAVPGPSAVVTALAVSGLPTGRFSFEGFLSTNRKGRSDHLQSLKNDPHTLVFYEAPHKLLTTLKDMTKAFGNRKIALCRELTKIHEEIRRTTLSEAAEYYEKNPPRGEFVLIIEGKSADEADNESKQEWQKLSVEEHIKLYLDRGMEEKEALRAVARDRGVSRRDVYNEYKR